MPGRKIQVQVDAQHGVLRGRISENDVEEEFEGWLGLLSVLSGLLDNLADSTPGATSPSVHSSPNASTDGGFGAAADRSPPPHGK